MQALEGLGVALVTPFHKDLSIDFEGLTNLLEFNIKNGTNYFVVMGTTAESATLSKEEKKEVLSHVLKVNNNRLPIVLGVGGNNTTAVVKEVQELETDGLTAILSVSPAYNKPTQDGIYEHFAAIARVSKLPILLYNVPGRTSSNITPATVGRLAANFQNIIGIKEATGDMTQVLKLLRNTPEDFMVISGDDTLAPLLISAGGKGVISVIGQGIPKAFSSVINELLRGNGTSAYKSHLPLLDIIDYIFEEGNPAGIKALLAALNICKPYVRLPLMPASVLLTEKIEQSLKDI